MMDFDNMEVIHIFWLGAALLVVACFVLICSSYCIMACCRKCKRNSAKPKKRENPTGKKSSEAPSIRPNTELEDEGNFEDDEYHSIESSSSDHSTIQEQKDLQAESIKTCSKPNGTASIPDRSEEKVTRKPERTENSVSITIDNPEMPKSVIVTKNDKPVVTVIEVDQPRSKSENSKSKLPASADFRETLKDALSEPMTQKHYRRASRRLKKKLNKSLNESLMLNLQLQQLNSTMLNQSLSNTYNASTSLGGAAQPIAGFPYQLQGSLPPLYPHQPYSLPPNVMYPNQPYTLPPTRLTGAPPLLNQTNNLSNFEIGNSSPNHANFNTTFPNMNYSVPHGNDSIHSISSTIPTRNLQDYIQRREKNIPAPQMINSTQILNPAEVVSTRREPYGVVLNRNKVNSQTHF